jgi:hypothetical protein
MIRAAAIMSLLATAAAADVVSARGGVLRMLDKMTGVVEDHDLARGQSLDCRYPSDLPTGEAFARVSISEADQMLFQGWMIASSPALSALDNPRYDVWVLRCDVPASEG